MGSWLVWPLDVLNRLVSWCWEFTCRNGDRLKELGAEKMDRREES